MTPTELYSGRPRRVAPDQAQAALTSPDGGSQSIRGRLLLDLARARALAWDARALPTARRGVGLLDSASDLRPRDRMTLAEASLVARREEAPDQYRVAGDAARAAGMDDLCCAAACGEARALLELGRPEEAREAAAAAERCSSTLGIADRVAEARWIATRADMALIGPHPDAIAVLTLLAPKVAPEWTDALRIDRALALADAGAFAEARASMHAVRSDGRGCAARQLATWALGELEWLAGRPEYAEAAAGTLLRAAPAGPLAPFAAVTRAWARADRGEASDSSAGGRMVAAVAGATTRAASDACAAVVALGTPGCADEAQQRFAVAADRFRGRLLREELRCRLGAAEAAGVGGDRERARRLLEAVERRAEAACLTSLAARARASAERHAPSRTAPATDGQPSLTGAEREVLVLVGRGLRSAEIARRRGVALTTVDSQIRSAVSKLGVCTRSQAAAQVAAQGAASSGELRVAMKAAIDGEAGQGVKMLELVASGAKIDEVAARTGYSRRTVSRRVAAARAALGARTTAQAAAMLSGREASRPD